MAKTVTAGPGKRIDPASRPTSGIRPWDKFHNLDPNRTYVLANPNDEYCGVNFYLGYGYRVERASKDGPRPFVGKTAVDGDEIKVFGQLLMSCEKEEYDARFAEGQALADITENRMVDKKRGADGFRGQHVRPQGGVDVVNETEPSYAIRE